MPDFEFTSPEGKKYTVSGPAGATKEQAFQMLQSQLSAPAVTSGRASDSIPGVTPGGLGSNRAPAQKSESAPVPQPAALVNPQTKQDTILGKYYGPLEAATTMATGAFGGLVGAVRGSPIGGLLSSSNAKDAKALEEEGGKLAEALTYTPRTNTGNALVQGIGNALNNSGIIGVPIPELNALGRAAKPAAQVAGNALSAGVANAADGVAMAGNTVARAVGNKLVPKVAPNIAELAQKAAAYDIPLRPDMLTTNKYARIIGDTLEKVPLSGSQGEARQTAFNKAIIGTIGGDSAAAKLTPDVFDAAMKQSGQKIGDIAAKTPIALDKELSQALASHVENAAKYETGDVARVINSYVEEIKSKAAADGIIPGEAFRKLNTAINKQARATSNGDLKHALGELQNDLQDALQKRVSGDDLATLLDARKQYAIGKTLEPLVAKSPTGDISPAALMGRVTANGDGKARMARGNGGDIGDLARIGQQFLKEPNSSNTAERGLAYGILGGGIATHPVAAATAYTAANAYNRLGPRVANALAQPKKP